MDEPRKTVRDWRALPSFVHSTPRSAALRLGALASFQTWQSLSWNPCRCLDVCGDGWGAVALLAPLSMPTFVHKSDWDVSICEQSSYFVTRPKTARDVLCASRDVQLGRAWRKLVLSAFVRREARGELGKQLGQVGVKPGTGTFCGANFCGMAPDPGQTAGNRKILHCSPLSKRMQVGGKISTSDATDDMSLRDLFKDRLTHKLLKSMTPERAVSIDLLLSSHAPTHRRRQQSSIGFGCLVVVAFRGTFTSGAAGIPGQELDAGLGVLKRQDFVQVKSSLA
ncbi:hypothetical protein QBC35DRAFT_472276 [Podospora australis]|uniref:Uncharacterized protein n=1 Tax=Podospora australis TaxID=1536484 RepID=A0AAN6WYA0_9PEZI|nr:hypothetical protein QBC35DRAFT_472276 [Podospora australis]